MHNLNLLSFQLGIHLLLLIIESGVEYPRVILFGGNLMLSNFVYVYLLWH